MRSISPPPGNWEILGRVNEITEQVWQGIVEKDWWYDGPQEQHGLGKVTYYREYPNEIKDSCLLSATESGLSWCRTNSIDLQDLILIDKPEKL